MIQKIVFLAVAMAARSDLVDEALEEVGPHHLRGRNLHRGHQVPAVVPAEKFHFKFFFSMNMELKKKILYISEQVNLVTNKMFKANYMTKNRI